MFKSLKIYALKRLIIGMNTNFVGLSAKMDTAETFKLEGCGSLEVEFGDLEPR